MKNHAENLLQKLVPGPFLILVDNPCKKLFQKLTLFFLLKPVPFNGQNYQKQKVPGTSNQLLFRLRNKFVKIRLLVIYYLTKIDDVI